MKESKIAAEKLRQDASGLPNPRGRLHLHE
jgi:hypothetical protein